MSEVLNTKHFLTESTSFVKKTTSYDPTTNRGIMHICADDNAFNIYAGSLCEGLNDVEKAQLMPLLENTRLYIQESNSQFNLNPYEMFMFPILRRAFPKTLIKEITTMETMEGPEIVKTFQVPVIYDAFGNPGVELPSYTAAGDMTKGPDAIVTAANRIPVPTTSVYNILASGVPGVSLDSNTAHVQKDFAIFKAVNANDDSTTFDVQPTIDGLFSHSLTIINTVSGDPEEDTIYGKIDYYSGNVEITSKNGVVKFVEYKCSISLEENKINPKIRFDWVKYNIKAVDRQVQLEWTIQNQIGAKKLYDVDMQTSLVDTASNQLALDIDREVIEDMINANVMNGPRHTLEFDVNPPMGYMLGEKLWLENIARKINKLSAVIYNDIIYGAGNTIVCNPEDMSYLESIQGFNFVGDAITGGAYGPIVGTVKNKYKILSSVVVPVGKALMLFKSATPSEVVYWYGPYIPAILQPYPNANKPAVTLLTSYGKRLLRPAGIAVLNIIDTAA